ncbi:DNL zinc finger-domain-containing protein [Scheffersomyces xylosifermentans]|uniref:DNL zinc finger-domain-containing protein n=1 Tax=Scheffersomyces xylosifermentans TaxID=1304137 RepID=UPI00315C74D0
MNSRLLFAASRRVAPLLSRRAVVSSKFALKPRFFTPLVSRRFNSSNSKDDSNTASFKVEDPQLMIAFTCKKCDTRSSHTFSRQAYYKGTVAIQCPGCKNRHLIADNLKIFKDNKFNIEDVLKAKGESVATGTEDLVFEDIPESLKATLGHYAKDAPEEFKREEDSGTEEVKTLPSNDEGKK